MRSRCEGAGCQCERTGECPAVYTTDAVAVVFKVIRASDYRVLYSTPDRDEADRTAVLYAETLRMGICNVVACEAAEEGEDA